MILKRNSKFFIIFLALQFVIVFYIVNNDTVRREDDPSAKQSLSHRLLDPTEPFNIPLEPGVNRSSVVVDRKVCIIKTTLFKSPQTLHFIWKTTHVIICFKIYPQHQVTILSTRNHSNCQPWMASVPDNFSILQLLCWFRAFLSQLLLIHEHFIMIYWWFASLRISDMG